MSRREHQRKVKSDAARIAERWTRFRPWALIAVRRGVMLSAAVDYGVLLESERQRHSRLCDRLLAAGLNWRNIDAQSLDDPKLDEVVRAGRIAVAIKASRAQRKWKAGREAAVAAIGVRFR